jgi:predicted porin
MKKLGILAAAAALTASSLFADGIQINKYLNLSGFVDMSYTNVDNDTGIADTASFNMDQAELDFTINAGEGLTARIDLQTSGGAGATRDFTNIEQARLDYAFGDWTLTLGKFDTFIGLEALEPTGMYQYSNSLIFALEPTQHTGISLGYDNGFFNGALALVNSLSVNNPNNNDEMAYALHAGVTPNKAWSVNLNYGISDDAPSVAVGVQPTSETTLLTLDVMWENFGWTVGAEYIDTELETSAGAATTTTDTDGYSLMVNYAFSERMALTGRFSTTDSSVNGTVGSTEKDEFSISPSYCFTKNWSGLLEYRKDTTSVTATPDVDTTTIALETTFTF